ncbi:MAG: hypothetical protein F6J89_16875 [Symploca sp. SIO1C4]|uniref:Uncharacterized protein n=1 Tax=Symploca sp. SIO1C4 TaxID=2607765 RepID=A0A6B3NHY6_9CYAN|nr:hypothetical protein [Symploca sp. SIO1C4]
MFNSAKYYSPLLPKALLFGICLYGLNAVLGMVAQAEEFRELQEQGQQERKEGNSDINNINSQTSRDENCREPQNLTPEERENCRPPAPTFFEQERKLEPEGFGSTFLENSLNGVSDPLKGAGSTSRQLNTPLGERINGEFDLDGQFDVNGGFRGCI